jgi:hypothetical protein
VVSRTVTQERVTGKLTCPDGASYGGSHALRRLAIKDLVVEAVDTDFNHAPDAPLTRSQVRVPLSGIRDHVRRCLGSTSSTLEMRALIIPAGAAFALDVTNKTQIAPDVATCVIDTIRNLADFPRADTATRARWRFEYTVEDPMAYVKPLDCSFVPGAPATAP